MIVLPIGNLWTPIEKLSEKSAGRMERLKTILRYMTPIHATYFVHYINLSLHIKKDDSARSFQRRSLENI